MGLPELWEEWEVKFLLLSSLALQVLLLIFTEWRRRISWALLSSALNGILWLLYQLADYAALYVLGHMSLNSKPREQQQLIAFWASMLLVHLGGQDTITAYAMVDNELWLRHLFTLVVQAAGTAYVLYKYVASGSMALLAAAILMFLVGFVKYGERVYALRSSGLDNIRNSLDGFDLLEGNRDREYLVSADLNDPEEVLHGAHDLLNVFMGQLVDYKVWPSKLQTRAILAYHDCTRTDPDGTTTATERSKLLELVGMQLSLMHDILYTKAAVIYTWYGYVSRMVSTVSIILAFYLFQKSAMSGDGYGKGDMVVTYVLLAGAFFLEVASLLRAAASTWTCAWLRAAGWNRLHEAIVYLRRGVRAAQTCRRWSGSIGQHKLTSFGRHSNQYEHTNTIASSAVISHNVEDLLLRDIQRMVEACGQDEHILRAYRGQLALREWGGADFICNVVGVEEIGFGSSILAWHYATEAFVYLLNRAKQNYSDSVDSTHQIRHLVVNIVGQDWEQHWGLAEATRTLSRYMVFLLVERPHLLPSPIRRGQYDSFRAEFVRFESIWGENIPVVMHPAVNLARELLGKCKEEGATMWAILRVISGVWVEMLCYAASHCSNDSHARQLSRETELITVVWILMTALYDGCYHNHPSFAEKAQYFLQRHDRQRAALSSRDIQQVTESP